MLMSLLGFMLLLFMMMLVIDNLVNGFICLLCGFILDWFGCENMMLIVFIGEGLVLLGLMKFGYELVVFMVFVVMVFLCWGEIFLIFLVLCVDIFGVKNVVVNVGVFYIVKGMVVLLVLLGFELLKGGNWDCVFILIVVILIGVGLVVKFVL